VNGTATEAASGLGARNAALGLLHAVLHERRMLGESALPKGLDPPDRARALDLAGAVLRHMGRIDALLAPWLERPPPLRLRNILRLAAAELLALGTPAHAAVDCAVRLATAAPKTRHLAGLVNAVARRIDRDGRAVWAGQDAADLALPDWLRRRLMKDWGAGGARAIALAGLEPAPLDLSLRDPAGAEAWAARLGARILPTGSLRLDRPGQVSALPGFAEGAWWVQDAAAALPARLLGDVRGLPVLDLCAAPGGKTLQLAAAGAAVTALDLPGPRIARLRDNLRRTGLAATIVEADAFAWSPRGAVAAILLDAPCSATGTIRRHPDLPHRLEPRDFGGLTALQDRLLDRAWSWLAPGGTLVFCTCSLLRIEGEGRLAPFLARHGDAVPADLPAIPGADPGWFGAGTLRTRPDFMAGQGGMDGFFAAVLRRRT
jgi:16S rRNA (cytosine967-C5)-methyltransferase